VNEWRSRSSDIHRSAVEDGAWGGLCLRWLGGQVQKLVEGRAGRAGKAAAVSVIHGTLPASRLELKGRMMCRDGSLMQSRT
jgi:hypothetical protein